MIFLNEGDITYLQGSGKKPYEIKKVGGTVSCSCPAWRNLGGTIDTRVCKHIKKAIDPACLLPQATQASAASTKAAKAPRLTKTGKVSTAVSGVVKKDTAPPVLLAHPWDTSDPTGSWMSEKLDGVRAWWDGEKFLSRLGNTYHAPTWFKKLLPAKTVLDGELWVGRKKFQKTISAVRKGVPTDSEWLDVAYVIYDAPEHGGVFEERYEYLKTLFPVLRHNGGEGVGMICILEQIKVTSVKHMKQMLTDVEALGGEGVMLRTAGSLYEADRSWTCMKVKTFFDAEAEVIGHTAGRGKHKGRTGALIVKWKNKEFEIGTGLSDKDREKPPAIGSMITFRYTALSDAGLPKPASYVCERNYE
ncbi:MAG: DNA ligase [Candidatus Paceibacterota bacterium]|jgi:DNA ligase-1